MKIKHKKLKEWASAGLITAEQGDAIHAYEEQKRGGRFGRGMIGLALFSILMGVLSIIASNWHAIPGEVKICVHVLLNLGIGGFALWADKQGKDIFREGAALVFMGLTFTLIVLIGQVYQLDGSFADALIFWFIITLPFFILMGKTYMTTVPWVLAMLTTLFYVVFEKLEYFLSDVYQNFVGAALIVLLPLAFMAMGTNGWLIRVREALASVLLRSGFIFTALVSSVVLIAWQEYTDIREYEDVILSQVQVLIIMLMGFAGIAAHALYHRFYVSEPALKVGAIFAGVSLLCSTIPALIPTIGAALLSALLFIGYWMFVGWLAQMAGKMRIVSLAITLIAIRIFVAYIELFGSLMNTGIGMIVGGIVLLGLMYGARKLNTYVKAQGGGSFGKI